MNRKKLSAQTRPLSELPDGGQSFAEALGGMSPERAREDWSAVALHFSDHADAVVGKLIAELDWSKANAHRVSDDAFEPLPTEYLEQDDRLQAIIAEFRCVDLEPLTRKPVRQLARTNYLAEILLELWAEVCPDRVAASGDEVDV